VSQAADLESPIWRKWQEGTRHHWAWPCPQCGEYFIPRFRHLRWPKGASPIEAKRGAFVECPNCGGIIEDEHKTDMNARGVYVAPGQHVTTTGVVIGSPPDTSTISFWVSGLCSPFKTFGERAERFVQAVKSGDPHEIQTAVNAAFGEAFAPAGGEAPEWRAVAALRGGYELGEVPAEAEVLTLTVDVQKDRLIYIVRGWGVQATSWLIDHGELWALSGSTAETDVWKDLGELVAAEYGGLAIKLALVDSGFRPGKPIQLPENRVYEFCRRFPRRVLPTKGHDTQRAPVIVRKPEVTSRGKVSLYGLDLVHLDTDHWKRWVFERVNWPADRNGAWHLPSDIADDYCMQIASEKRLVTASGRVIWKQTSQNNHALDCEAMAAAAGFILGVHRRQASTIERRISTNRAAAVDAPRAFAHLPPMTTADDPYL
jgi:phage terminase large subunit GpA-like protein